MEKIETFQEVKYALKSREVITSNGVDNFFFKDDHVTRVFKGSSYKMSLKDFIELYKDTTFYRLPASLNVIDENKDIEYYGRIQRKN